MRNGGAWLADPLHHGCRNRAMPLSFAPPISWKTEPGDRGATDDSVAVCAMNRATSSRMKSVSRMNVSVCLCALVAGVSLGDGQAIGESGASLPRVFQQAGLGMEMKELLRLKPEIEKTKRLEGGIVTFTTVSGDRHIKRVEYRLHAGKLSDITIHYRLDRLPHGAVGLLAQLKEAYGPPALDREEHFDREHGDIGRWGTIWEDAQTRMTLLERQYLSQEKLLTTLALTMTDLELRVGMRRPRRSRCAGNGARFRFLG